LRAVVQTIAYDGFVTTLGGATMPIYRMFNNHAFEPARLRAMGLAFEQALDALPLVNRDDPAAKLIAMKIIELGLRGERDPQRLRDFALIAFQSLAPTSR
jgi:hypothetical protein